MMRLHMRGLILPTPRIPLPLLAAALGILLPALPAIAEDDTLSEIVVTGHRQPEAQLDFSGNIRRLDAELLDQVAHQHIHQLLTRVPGVWLSRGSGQEHLTAIRSPVLTGAGSCGAFLYLEDGIPIRPAGFCNVNALFEVNTEQAAAIETIRGPANALFGSNAMHGVINVLMPMPLDRAASNWTLEVGANDFYRVGATLPADESKPWLLSGVVADDGGFRDDAGYTQGKLHLKRRWSLDRSQLTGALTYTRLDQDTAGFIVGRNAYRDPALAGSNPNPEAFREAEALRAYGIWQKRVQDIDVDVRPYLRYSDMRFLQHFLPGQPLEENGHKSIGALAAATFSKPGSRTVIGIDFEWSDVFLRETQADPAAGSAFLTETRPVGDHYDYTVDGLAVAAYLQADRRLGERIDLAFGLRLDHTRYDYDNRMLIGNTRDDGSECGFGGCLYTRPADRSDSFSNLAPKFSLSLATGPATRVFAVLARAFRVPQMSELYRLQSGQEVADLDSETIDSFELGMRGQHRVADWEIAAYTMRKRDSVYRDADGFNINGGRSKHAGVEVSVDWTPGRFWQLLLDAGYARHQYDFNAVALRGETFRAGREMDTAPRFLGSIEVRFAPSDRLEFAMQWTALDDYYLDAENRFTYPGHSIVNLRAAFGLSDRLQMTLRLNNAWDRAFADRADYAFGNYRYFPGRGRELFAEIRYTP